MFDFLRDPMWQFIGALIGLITVAITIIIYLIQRRSKKLDYELISKTSLLSVQDEVDGRVQIVFEGTHVQKVHLIICKVSNSGNVSIVSSDYEIPLSFEMGPDSRILSAEVTEVLPKDLLVDINVNGNAIRVSPCLLNGSDSFSIKALIGDYDGTFAANARIAGVKEIRKVNPSLRKSFALILAGSTLSIGGLVYSLANSIRACSTPFDNPEEAIGFSVFIFGYFLVVIGLVLNKRMRSRYLQSARRLLRLFRLT